MKTDQLKYILHEAQEATERIHALFEMNRTRVGFGADWSHPPVDVLLQEWSEMEDRKEVALYLEQAIGWSKILTMFLEMSLEQSRPLTEETP
jgi:hypothetical protein